MSKNQLEKRAYVKPAVEVSGILEEQALLAGSPNVQPGGGGGGSIIVVPPEEDNDDDNISGAKRWYVWEDEEEKE